MTKKTRAPYRVGANNNSPNSKLINEIICDISDLVWQGLKYTMEELKSSAPYGDGSPTNKLLRNYYLKGVLDKGFYYFYRLVNYSHTDALILKENAMKIWKEHYEASVSDIDTKLLAENMWGDQDTIAKAKKSNKEK